MAIVPFAMVFFAIWWAWMNFTWFASAFDNDGPVYRLNELEYVNGEVLANVWQTNLIARIETLTDPYERLRELFRASSRDMRSHRTYAALLTATDHKVVAPVLERVAAERMGYLARVFAQAGMKGIDAEYRARLAYSAYVGFLQLTLQLKSLKLSNEDLEAYVEHVIGALIP